MWTFGLRQASCCQSLSLGCSFIFSEKYEIVSVFSSNSLQESEQFPKMLHYSFKEVCRWHSFLYLAVVWASVAFPT